MPHQLLKYRALPNSRKMLPYVSLTFRRDGVVPFMGRESRYKRFYMQYLQKDDDPVLRVLICCYVEHAETFAVHDPVVHLCVGAYISVRRFDSGHHRLHGQRLRHRVLIVLWKTKDRSGCW